MMMHHILLMMARHAPKGTGVAILTTGKLGRLS